MQYDEKEYAKLFEEWLKEGRIRSSNDFFKINLFEKKGENSLLIAKHLKELVPNKDQPKRLYWDYWAITVSYYSILYVAKAAILSKGYEVKDHDAAQIALGHLMVPDEIEIEDLKLLNQAHKIFEEEYVHYFEDAKVESQIARYSAINTYTKRRLDEIFERATDFVKKISLILT